MAKKLPGFMFYPGDWMKDPGLRSVSYAARGLWIDLCCHLWETFERGFMVINGVPATSAQIARLTGGEENEVNLLLCELETAGVFSRDERKAIFCRRIVREERTRALCADAGRKGGGNPNFSKGKSKGDPKGHPKGAHEYEYVNEEEEVKGDARGKPQAATAIPPTLEAVIAHGITIMLPADQCQQFMDHYTANGWKVGRNPMRNWKSAMQNWLRNFRAGTYTKGNHNGNGKHPTPTEQRRSRECEENLTL